MSVTSPGAGELAESVFERVALARERIARAGGDPGRVRIVAVTKGFGPGHVAAALSAGLVDIGENYADELVAKWPAGAGRARWHFLGSIQRNKVGRLAPLVDCWQCVARIEEAESILRRREGSGTGAEGAPVSMLVEVETTGIAGRGGCTPEAARVLVGRLRSIGAGVVGLMTVAPPGDEDRARRSFGLVAALAEELGLAELSMGMSADLEQAVAAGATMVRLGTALFGPRPNRSRLQQ